MKVPKRILVVGDAGLGKTTFAQRLSKKTGIPVYSTDDFFWKKKFTEPHNREQSIVDISKIYNQDNWIVEGGTTHLVKEGIEKADEIYFLEPRNIFVQYLILIKRSLSRPNEKLLDLFKFLRHLTYKRYGWGYKRGVTTLADMLKPYENKIMRFYSHADKDRLINNIK